MRLPGECQAHTRRRGFLRLSGLEQFCPNAIDTYAAPNRHLGGTTHALTPR